MPLMVGSVMMLRLGGQSYDGGGKNNESAQRLHQYPHR